MTADWDALVDAAPPEVREALDRLRHHVVLTTGYADAVTNRREGLPERHTATREAMDAVLAWASEQEATTDA